MTLKTFGAGIALAGTLGTAGIFGADARQNPYADKGTHYELPLVSEIPQNERVEIAKDRAALTLKGWNDEYAITITPQIPTALLGAAGDRPFTVAAKRPLLSKKIEFKSGDVTAFIEPKAGTQNEFDIDFTLESKPDTNVFTYKIEGAEEFDFFYQPELTPEEIADGAERPDNVVGSYAVYHKEKANHHIGSTNYGTGKAFHIYRPKAIDANGAEVWAELEYAYVSDRGYLWVTVPQDFLEKAAYPVVVDPTFGYTTIGGTNLNRSTIFLMGYRFTAPESGTVDSISWYSNYWSTSGTEAYHLLLYSESSGVPDVRIGYTVEGTLSSTEQWRTNNITSGGSFSASTDYFISAAADDATTQFDSGTTNYFRQASDTSYSYPESDPFGAIAVSQVWMFSIYATYTASGGGAAPSVGEFFWGGE